MARLLLADDEPLVLELLKKLIDFPGFGLELVGEAGDGVSALALIEKLSPDIVITDIRMPGLDGLEIVERVRAAGNARTRFVIVSGHKHFDYAYSAIKFGVEDYLLKPIGKQELNNTLSRICREIDGGAAGEVTARKDAQRLPRDLMLGELAHTGMDQVNRAYGLRLTPGLMVCAVFAFDMDGDAEADASILPIVQKKLGEVLEVTRRKGYELALAHVGQRSALVMNFKKDKPEAGQRELKYVFEEMLGITEPYENLHVTLGVGSAEGAVTGLTRSMALAEGALYERMFGGVDRLYSAREEAQAAREPQVAWQQLPQILQAYADDRLLVWLDEALHQLQDPALSARQRVLERQAFARRFFRCAVEAGMPRECVEASRAEIEQRMQSAFRITAIDELLRDELTQFVRACLSEKKAQQNWPVLRAQQYIRQHFAEELYLDQLAAFVGLSPVYLSGLFKKETGITISQYTMDLRMAEARKLLRDPKLNISEIAYRVGYADPKHFSKVFKAQIGILPTQFRALNA